jgi:hypothetical protein
MTKKLKLHMLVGDGHLRLMPKGNMTLKDINLILGTARSALKVFPVIVIDLLEVREVAEQVPALLEDGLRSLIGERKLTLLREMPHLCWKIYQPETHDNPCACQGNCRNCPCRSAEVPQEVKGKARTGSD